MGSNRTAGAARRKIRQKLLRWGMDKKEVELCMQQIQERQIAKKLGRLSPTAPLCTRAEYARFVRQKNNGNNKGSAVLNLGNDYEPPDDTGYKPTKVDSVLTGQARAVGSAAKAVKRRKTLTKYQYDKENET